MSTTTNQYLRDQLVALTEQFASLTLPSTDRMMREVYLQSSNTFIIEKRNLSELVIEMANYTNLAIMKKLEAIHNLVNISEQSYRRFAETDEATRNATAKFMEVRARSLADRLVLTHLRFVEVRLSQLETCGEQSDQRHGRQLLFEHDAEHDDHDDHDR